MSGHSDNRTVATDALQTLGTIIGENEKRDAIHLAVEPATAAHPLSPGQDVGRLSGGAYGACDKPLGIVDPFLKGRVFTGDRFWLVLYPRQVTSLRHVWTHPAFEDELLALVSGANSADVEHVPRAQREELQRTLDENRRLQERIVDMETEFQELREENEDFRCGC